MEWLAPVSALVGVILGGVLNASLTVLLDRRREMAAASTTARLLRNELRLLGETVRAALRDGRWSVILDPGLPYMGSLSSPEPEIGRVRDSVWSAEGGALARVLTFEEWEAVGAPFDLVDRIGLHFFVDRPDRRLTDEARTYLERLVETIPGAIEALESPARGLRRGGLSRRGPRGGVGDGGVGVPGR